jgi:hypothetical protein
MSESSPLAAGLTLSRHSIKFGKESLFGWFPRIRIDKIFSESYLYWNVVESCVAQERPMRLVDVIRFLVVRTYIAVPVGDNASINW